VVVGRSGYEGIENTMEEPRWSLGDYRGNFQGWNQYCDEIWGSGWMILVLLYSEIAHTEIVNVGLKLGLGQFLKNLPVCVYLYYILQYNLLLII
jgi:hypothetical protein